MVIFNVSKIVFRHLILTLKELQKIWPLLFSMTLNNYIMNNLWPSPSCMHSLKDVALQVNKSCLKSEDKEQTDQNNVTQSLPSVGDIKIKKVLLSNLHSHEEIGLLQVHVLYGGAEPLLCPHAGRGGQDTQGVAGGQALVTHPVLCGPVWGTTL